MCGYIRRGGYRVRQFLKQFGLEDLWDDQQPQVDIPEHFYPAFGGAAAREIKQLIIRDEGALKTVNATWWFECREVNGKLLVDNTMTTFNARNLRSRYWTGAIRHHRGIVVATGLGESKAEDQTKKKHQYLIESNEPIMIGAVYRKFTGDLYSTAVITRDAHPRFSNYHDKAFPLFLPNSRDFVDLWLSDEPETHPEIAHLLENPRIFTDLKVTPVKTFKDAAPMGETLQLHADQSIN